MGEANPNSAYKPTPDMGAALELQAELAQKIKSEQAVQQAVAAPAESVPPASKTAPDAAEAPTQQPAETTPGATPDASKAVAQEAGPPVEAKPKPLTPEEERRKARMEAHSLTSTWMKKESERIDKVKKKHPNKRLSQGEEAIATIKTCQEYADGTKQITAPIQINTDPSNKDGGQPIQYTVGKKGEYRLTQKGGMTIQQVARVETRKVNGKDERFMVCALVGGREVSIPAQAFVSLVKASEAPAIIAHATTKSEQLGAVVAATISPDTQKGKPPITHGQVESTARSIKMLSIDNVQTLLAHSGVNETVQQGIIALVGNEAFVDVHTTAEILYQLDFHNNPLRSMDHTISKIEEMAKNPENPQEAIQAQHLLVQLKEQRKEIEAHVASFGKTQEDVVKNLKGSLTKMNDAEFTSFVGALVDDDKKAAFDALLENVPEDQREKFRHLLEGTAKYGSIAALAMIVLIVMQAAGGER